MKSYLILAVFFMYSTIQAQGVDNKFLGKYIAQSKSELYEDFAFYNNGKVGISEIFNADYFVKEDTLIIFPDKSMFKFIIKKNELLGVSEWVKNGKWVLTKNNVEDKRKDNDFAKRNALLLNEYYEKTRIKENPTEILFNEKLKAEYMKTIENLCSRGLVRACKEVFGMHTLNQIGGIEKVLTNKATSSIEDNPQLLEIANNVVKIDSLEGYQLLFLYYTITKQTDKANKAAEIAVLLRNKEAFVTKLNMELAQTNAEMQDKTDEATLKRKDYEPLFISTLRMFNQQKFSEIEQEDLKLKYGFKLIDKTIDNNVEIRDYENDKFNKLIKFQYKDIKNNRIEYTTNNLEELNIIMQDLHSYTKTVAKNVKTGEIREDYKLVIKLGKGYVQNCHIQILYPPKTKPNEPITLLLFE